MRSSSLSVPTSTGTTGGLQYTSRTLSPEEERAVVIQMGLGEILAPEQEALAAQTTSYNSQAILVAQTNEPTRPCHYASQSCSGFTADELSLGVPGVRQHLWQHHHNDHVRESNGRLVCQWKEGTDEACSQTITDLGNLARHMTSVHLRLTVHKCPTCGAQFSRMDALRRHCKKCP